MKAIFGALSFILPVCLIIATSVHADDWKQTDHTDDGITVFKKDVAGSDVVAFRGHGVVDAAISLVTTIIFDTSRGTEWIEDLGESKILRWLNPSEFIEYDHIETPFVMKDRDFVTHVTMSPDPSKSKILISYQSADDPSSPRTSYVRGDMIHANFVLISTENGSKTDVDADIHCDPKGSVPKWIVNFFQSDWPVTTFRNLRKQAKKPDVRVDPRFSYLK